ncbi:hypothetical protein [Collimonas fungivorans]|uniref:hypothetical protein n=1 Tax=Collimonas fungivorans TaxID=158899 RepID=UPI000778581D|nr:hypothetical protein [Collimonas fungivorans]
MTKTLAEKRKETFSRFYEELMPVLVEFVGQMGIIPGHAVLKQAAECAPYLSQALENMVIAEDDKAWLFTRVGYFVGEYFAQKYSGAWYVNEIEGSRYFARYVVGKFSRITNPASMIDPFQIAEFYVQQPAPRHLVKLLTEVETEL